MRYALRLRLHVVLACVLAVCMPCQCPLLVPVSVQRSAFCIPARGPWSVVSFCGLWLAKIYTAVGSDSQGVGFDFPATQVQLINMETKQC